MNAFQEVIEISTDDMPSGDDVIEILQREQAPLKIWIEVGVSWNENNYRDTVLISWHDFKARSYFLTSCQCQTILRVNIKVLMLSQSKVYE